MSQKAIDSVVAGTAYLFDETINELKDRISKRLHEGEISSSISDEIEDICDEVSSPFNGLETEWLQHSYCKENFGFQVK